MGKMLSYKKRKYQKLKIGSLVSICNQDDNEKLKEFVNIFDNYIFLKENKKFVILLDLNSVRDKSIKHESVIFINKKLFTDLEFYVHVENYFDFNNISERIVSLLYISNTIKKELKGVIHLKRITIVNKQICDKDNHNFIPKDFLYNTKYTYPNILIPIIFYERNFQRKDSIERSFYIGKNLNTQYKVDYTFICDKEKEIKEQ